MKNGRNLRRLILFSLATGCTLGGLGSGDVYAGDPPYEQILYINENNTVTQHDTDPNLQVDTSGLLKDGNFTYDTGDKLSKEKRGLIIMNSKKNLNSYTVRATLGADSSMTMANYGKSDYQTILLESGNTAIHDVNLQVDGLLSHRYGGSGVYGIYSGGGNQFDNLTIKSDLKTAIYTLIPNWIPITRRDAALRIMVYMLTKGRSSMSRGIPISTTTSPREHMMDMTMSMTSILRGT